MADILVQHAFEHLHVGHGIHHPNDNKDISDMLSYHNFYHHEDKGECYLGSIINDPKGSCAKDYKLGTSPFAPVEDYKLLFNNLQELKESAKQTTGYENTMRNIATGSLVTVATFSTAYVLKKLCCRNKKSKEGEKVKIR